MELGLNLEEGLEEQCLFKVMTTLDGTYLMLIAGRQEGDSPTLQRYSSIGKLPKDYSVREIKDLIKEHYGSNNIPKYMRAKVFSKSGKVIYCD